VEFHLVVIRESVRRESMPCNVVGDVVKRLYHCKGVEIISRSPSAPKAHIPAGSNNFAVPFFGAMPEYNDGECTRRLHDLHGSQLTRYGLYLDALGEL
jgi:hypothetical protein